MNEDVIQRYRDILNGATADSSTESLELGPDLVKSEMERIKAMSPAQLAAENEALRAQLAEEGVESPSIASTYRPGTERYQLLWPFDPNMPMELPFDQQDRETQFYTLSAAWSGRRLDGHRAMHAGKLDEAEAIFRECLARADQLDLDGLRSQSNICLSYVANHRGDKVAQRQYLEAARIKKARTSP